MANIMRWRYGDTNPVVLAVAADTEIEIGDLLYLDTADQTARPASAQPDQLSESANQAEFHLQFAGVAMQRSRVGDASPLRVATSGVFEFDCPATVFEVGDLIGAKEDASGERLANQTVALVEDIALAIGRCARREPAASSRVLVAIVSSIAHGGPQPVAE